MMKLAVDIQGLNKRHVFKEWDRLQMYKFGCWPAQRADLRQIQGRHHNRILGYLFEENQANKSDHFSSQHRLSKLFVILCCLYVGKIEAQIRGAIGSFQSTPLCFPYYETVICQ